MTAQWNADAEQNLAGTGANRSARATRRGRFRWRCATISEDVASCQLPVSRHQFSVAWLDLKARPNWKLVTGCLKSFAVLWGPHRKGSNAGAAVAASLSVILVAPGPLLAARAVGAASHQTGSSSPPTSAADSREALQRAAHLVQQGHLEDAEAQVQLALSNPETRGAAHSVLGAIRFQQERLDESARLLQEAIRLEPRLIGAHLTLAEVRIAQGQPEPAVALFRRALELDPMNPTARFGLARSEAEKGNYQASLDIARPVIEAFRLFPEGLFVLATDFLKTGDRAAAIALVDPWNRSTDIPQAWSIRLAVMYAEEGVPAAAIAILERAKTVAPVSYGLAFNLAVAYLLNGDAVRLNDKSANANYQLGLLLARMGRKDDADKQLALAKQLREEDEATSRLQLRLLEPDR